MSTCLIDSDKICLCLGLWTSVSKTSIIGELKYCFLDRNVSNKLISHLLGIIWKMCVHFSANLNFSTNNAISNLNHAKCLWIMLQYETWWYCVISFVYYLSRYYHVILKMVTGALGKKNTCTKVCSALAGLMGQIIQDRLQSAVSGEFRRISWMLY